MLGGETGMQQNNMNTFPHEERDPEAPNPHTHWGEDGEEILWDFVTLLIPQLKGKIK